ncbi:hypothetical protein ACHQM5_019586 [Ranunculus cassubicifolius]
MASKHIVFIVIIVTSAILPTVTSTEQYLVGDHTWKTGVDFQEWVNEHKFYVGDELFFVYFPQQHNVFKVNETGYKNCIVPPIGEALGDGSGNVNIIFTMPGKVWFICGMEDNCLNGMKVEIAVQDYQHVALPPTPIPSPLSAAHCLAMIRFEVSLGTVVALILMVVA